MIDAVRKSAALAAILVATTGTDTSAQKYFMRERIVGVPISVSNEYVPTYSTTFNACSGGTQSAAIASCATRDGKPTSLSNCSRSPQSTSRTCVEVACDALVRSKSATAGVITSRGSITSFASAQTACGDFAKQYGAGACNWRLDENRAYYTAPVASLRDDSSIVAAAICR